MRDDDVILSKAYRDGIYQNRFTIGYVTAVGYVTACFLRLSILLG